MSKILTKGVIFVDKKPTNTLIRWSLGVVGVLLAMYLCANAGYHFVRKNAPSQVSESAHDIQDSQKSNKPFPNLPVGISGTYSEEENLVTDRNDYLVVSEGSLVNLYTIDQEGNQIFERVLDIDPNELRAEDRQLLQNGIILGTREALLSLIEDYSS